MSPTESPTRIEPCELETIPPDLSDAIAELVRAATTLGSRLHPRTASGLAELVSIMNCYYSNLIEGHRTRPKDIERALADDLDSGTRRDLQLEARAHIRVQREIEALFLQGTLGDPTSCAFAQRVHRSFYVSAPKSALSILRANGNTLEMTPGEFRSAPEHDVVVGRHMPPSSTSVPGFMEYFERRYRLGSMGLARKLIAMAAAHHRFNYIHPFPDGNGRVSRLMSHAIGLEAGIGAHGLWSISRGLARGLRDRSEYKQMMDAADSPRTSDLDGRGNLSAKALLDFVTWFLSVAHDQVAFMAGLFDFDRLRERLREYVLRSLQVGEDSALLVDEVFLRGTVPRGEAARITKRPERTARLALSKLLTARLLASETPKGDVHLRFASDSAEFLFPRLFPAQAEETTTVL
jgi:Fic family protein